MTSENLDRAGALQESLPEGLVTLLLADLERSTPLWEQKPEAMREALSEVDALLDEACARNGAARPRDQGEGDSFLLSFASPRRAAACAWSLRQEFASRSWPGGLRLRFRMALHTGEVELRDGRNYAGAALARCARVRDLGAGGQLLVTATVHSLVLQDLPPGVRLVEHGPHELRGLERPEQVYELLAEDEVVRALGGATDVAHPLPREIESLVGRESECAELPRLLEGTPLVTLIGSGGSGKTRLALRVAHQNATAYTDGARWIDVAELHDPALVATAVGAATDAGVLAEDPPVASLARALARRQVLIVLDNCEHLVAACAEIARALAVECPGVRLLATSREPLGVSGEAPFRVESLSVPAEGANLDEVAQAEAVRLLVERARRVRPGFALTEGNAVEIAGICRRLDGLPLALELAAARLRVLGPGQVLDALADRFRLLTGGARGAVARQRTLEASVDWSYELLGDDERRLLDRLAIFPGSFDLAAAEAVGADAEADAYAVLDVLTRLVDRSLVRADLRGRDARYALLETIRVYAAARLRESDDDVTVLRDRHLDHYAERVGELAPELRSPDQGAAGARLGTELANLRNAFDWAVESGKAETAIALIEASYDFWALRGLQQEALERLSRALEAPELDRRARARGYVTAGLFAHQVGEFTAEQRLGAAGLELAREEADPVLLGNALEVWAGAAVMTGAESAETCRDALEEAVALLVEVGAPDRVLPFGSLTSVYFHSGVEPSQGEPPDSLRDVLGAIRAGNFDALLDLFPPFLAGLPSPQMIVRGFSAAAHAARLGGRPGRSVELASRAIEIGEGEVEGAILAMAYYALALVGMQRGELDAAAAQVARARALARIGGRQLHTEFEIDNPEAELAYRRGEAAAAREWLEAGLGDARRRGHLMSVAGQLFQSAALDLDAGDHGAARRSLEEMGSIARPFPHRIFVGLSELGLAWLTRREGEPERAFEHAHDALVALAGMPWFPSWVFEVLAGLCVGRGRAELGARLLGAAQQSFDNYGYERRPVEQVEHAAAHEAVRAALDAETFEAAFEAGRTLSLDEALELAQRGRGPRSRPSSGWESLTPAELEVARLVAEGLTNAAIAKKLFVSPHTVKTHLAHAFGKLDVSSRAELAAEAVRKTT